MGMGKLDALTGLEFKQQLPLLKDADTDFDRHWREVQSIVDCHSFGRRGVRPYDVLMILRKSLAPGSVRLRYYDTEMKKARKRGRLPADAAAVLEEIRDKLKKCNRQTRMQRQDKADRVFEALSQGALPHSSFRALWEEALEELEDAACEIPGEATLRRKYVWKLNADLRSAVLGKLWPLDSEADPPRRPKTWEEVAECVEMELESRADTRTGPLEQAFAVKPSGGPGPEERPKTGGSLTCGYCQMVDNHFTEACPQRVADLLGDTAKCEADCERTGARCCICNSGRHQKEHHRAAHFERDPVVQARGRGGPDGRPSGPEVADGAGGGAGSAGLRPGGPAPPAPVRDCWFGKKCRRLTMPGGCPHRHPLEHYDQQAKEQGTGEPRLEGNVEDKRGPVARDGRRKRGECYACGKKLEEHESKRWCSKGNGGAAVPASTTGGGGGGSGKDPTGARPFGGRLAAGSRGHDNGGRDTSLVMMERSPVVDFCQAVSQRPGQEAGKEVDLVAWLRQKAAQAGEVPPGTGLAESFALAAKAGLPVATLDDLAADGFELQTVGRPVGYCAQTQLFFLASWVSARCWIVAPRARLCRRRWRSLSSVIACRWWLWVSIARKIAVTR